jgi:hypothetical protein
MGQARIVTSFFWLRVWCGHFWKKDDVFLGVLLIPQCLFGRCLSSILWVGPYPSADILTTFSQAAVHNGTIR